MSIFFRIQESILSVLSTENLFQYEHFYENLKWTAVGKGQALFSQVVST